MNWLFKSQSKSDTRASSSELFRAVEFGSYAAGEGMQFVRAKDGADVQLLPSFVVDFLESCYRFVPLREHVQRYATYHELAELETQSLETWLPRLCEMDLFISADLLREESIRQTSAASTPAKMNLIGIPTGNSRDQLRRALESFAVNARTHGRDVRFAVASNATDEGAGRGVAAEIERAFGTRVTFFGEAEKRELMRDLVAASGCDPEMLEFALFDPEQCGFLCGANRNTLLLHGAGEMFSSADDDMVCRISTPPEGVADGLQIFAKNDILERWFYPNRERALQDANYVEMDYLGLHEAWLGRSVGDCMRDRERVTLEKLSDDVLGRLHRADARVVMTCTGHVGDPGIPTSYYHLLLRNESFRRLTESEPFYRAALGARSVRSLAPLPCLGDASLSPGMAIGLDGRDLLPPFIPVLHAEDYAYGAALWQCAAGGFLGHIPYALNHEPGLGKPILKPGDLNETNRATIFEFAQLLRQVLFEYQPSPAEEITAVRMAGLGRHLRGISEASFGNFTNYLREATLRFESQKIRFLENRLREEKDEALFWRRDLEEYLERIRANFGYDDFDLPYDLKNHGDPDGVRRLMQRLFGRYGCLLEAWPSIFEAAKKLPKTGT